MSSNSVNVKDLKFKIDSLDVKNNSIIIYGKCSNLFKCNSFYFLDNLDNKYDVNYLDSISSDINIFMVEIAMDGLKSLVPKICVEYDVYSLKIEFGINSKLNSVFASLYLNGTNNIVKYNKVENRFDIYKNNLFNSILFELKCIYFLIKKKKIKNLFIREWINICNFFKSRELWLITDRSDYANDNGEEFFKHVINEELNPDTKYFFALDKKSRDYKRLYYNYSNVININSLRYKLLFLNCDKVVSSHIDNININPFLEDKIYLSDLYRHKFIYLQHRNNLKNIVSNNLDIDMITTNNKEEYDYLSDNMIKKDSVKLTGYARCDFTSDSIKKKQILILSSLRSEESDCFSFYNRLINDDRILEVLDKYDYKIRFICDNYNDFDKNDLVSFGNKDIIYSDEFNSSSLLITDSIDLGNDFAYLKRPVIYNSFGKDEDFLFGEVCSKYDSLVKEIIKCIKKDCSFDKKYEKKVDKYFEYLDNGNCKRIYDEIVK